MREIIRNRELVVDTFIRLADDEQVVAGSDLLVSFARFLEDPATLLMAEGGVGVELSSEDEIARLVPYFDRIELIALHFPKFSDGRGYTTARLLRRAGWTGELRATGDVLPDQVFYLHRCGFDAFEVRADKRLETALRALNTFSVTYQAAEQGSPLYRQRLAGERSRASGQ